MIRQNIFCSSTIEGHIYRRRAERKQASLIRLGMARIRARTAISFVLLVYAGRVLAQGAPASPEHVWHTSEERRTLSPRRFAPKSNIARHDRPEDLVFQSVRTGVAMRDNNILSRHIKQAARKLGLPWINWRCLRTSHATWMVEAGANPKDVQGQMRHSRISTTMDIYAQFVPESQRRALAKMSAMVESRTSKRVAATGSISMPPQSGMVN